jgi:hypothetical protein
MRRHGHYAAIVVLGLAGIQSASAQEASRTVWVAPRGDDAAPGTAERPLATLARARDVARERHRELGARSTVDIVLRGGRFELERTLELGPEDSCTTWRSADGELATISGARECADARGPEADRLRERLATEVARVARIATLPPAADKRQLFVGDERRLPVTLPRGGGFFRIAELPDRKPDTPWHDGQTRFVAAAGDLDAWLGLAGEAEVVAYHLWIESRLPVRAFDPATRMVELAKRSTFRLSDDHGPGGARYRVENVLAKLEQPGEWATLGEFVAYVPDPARDRDGKVRAPVLRRLVELTGDLDARRFVEDVEFVGLAFEHTLAESPPNGWPSSDVAGPPQAAVTAPGAIAFRGARRSALRRCRLQHLGSYAIELGAGSQENVIERCELSDLGAGGVKIGETALAKDDAHVVKRNTLVDSHLHDGGELFPSAVGVLVLHASENVIVHCEVDHFFYTGLSIGWSWGYGESGAFGNVIEKNHVHDIGRGLLSDMGGIYTLGVSPGTVIRGNVFHDVESYGYGGWGIYFDEGTTGVVAERNVVWGCKSNGFHQHYGRDNVVRNNVFAFAREAQIARTRAEPHRSFTFEENVVVWNSGELCSGNWEGDGFAFDSNVYWDVRGGFSLDERRARGLDVHSLAADPRFVDAAAHDFRLAADSPARALGIESIDASDVGPRPEAR